MRLRARRTWRGPNWRDERHLEDRADAGGVTLKEEVPGEEGRICARTEKPLCPKNRRILAPTQFSRLGRRIHRPTHQKRRASRRIARAPLGGANGDFAHGTCVACRETRLDATYRMERCGERIWLGRSPDKQGVFYWENNAPPRWSGAEGKARYDFPDASAALTIAEKLLIALLSVTMTIHRHSNGGFSSTGRGAMFPRPVELMAEARPQDCLPR